MACLNSSIVLWVYILVRELEACPVRRLGAYLVDPGTVQQGSEGVDNKEKVFIFKEFERLPSFIQFLFQVET